MVNSENFNSEQKNLSTADEAGILSRIQSLKTLTIMIGLLTGFTSFGMLLLFLMRHQWQTAVLSGLFGATTFYCYLSLRHFFSGNALKFGMGALSLFFSISLLAASALLDSVGIPCAIIYLVISLIISSSAIYQQQANLSIGNGVVVAALCTLLTEFWPYEQLVIPTVQVITPAILGVLFMTYIVMLATQFVTATLRIRLVTAFMAIVIIPLAILSTIQSQYMFSVLSREINQGLELAAQQTALGIDTFLTDTERSIHELAHLDVFDRYLETHPELRRGSLAEQQMKMALGVLDTSELHTTVYLSSYAILDMDGYNLYDTLYDRYQGRWAPEVVREMGIDIDSLYPSRGIYEGDQNYFLVSARSGTTYISPVMVNNSTKGFFVVSAPIKNDNGETIGVLRVRYDALMLQDLLKSYNGLLGNKSYAILLDEHNIRLADAFTPNNIYKAVAPLPEDQIRILKSNYRLPGLPSEMLSTNYEEFDQLLSNVDQNKFFRTHFSLVYGDTEHAEIGAVVRTRSMPWKVVYLNIDYNDEVIRQEQQRRTVLATTLIACVVGIIAMGAAHLLSQPIVRLTETAQIISMGDLNAQAPVHDNDEFGKLGSAFNLMTAQLRSLIGQLEERVKARTQEIEHQNLSLANRATQLQTVSEVARQIVSSQELEALLATITRLISERFDFYHVGIFLLDENNEYAVLRAANSEGGQRMLARNHKLPVGKVGIVGYATGMGEPRIATDVGADAVFFNNPDLPTTRSEMALPLKFGNQIIGAIDIQSTESNAFKAEDIELFTTLADQVAIAIYNNQLYMETRAALEDAQQLHRQYLRGEWAADVAHRKILGYVYNGAGTAPQRVENPLWAEVFNTGEPVLASQPDNGTPGKSMMALPISIRGETIGVVHVQDQGEDRTWSEDEIAVVNSIANQVAVALENARLFETTVRRAEREKKVVEITAKIRSTNDPEEMMRIAVNELQNALRATRTQIYIRQPGEPVEKA